MTSTALACASLVLVLCAASGRAADEASALAHRVAAAAGIEAWSAIQRLRFTWHVVPKHLSRSYYWNTAAATVAVTIGSDAPVTIPAAGPADAADQRAVEVHKAFVNDSYWLLFALHLAWDRTEAVDLGEAAVPQFPALGSRRALQITYPNAGGYTPGDRYILYLGDDLLPVAWAFHKAAADQPTLVTSWERYADVGGLRLPTLFKTPDGADFITIESLSSD
jgi:hypothetical protein